jgi:hypothetical protein
MVTSKREENFLRYPIKLKEVIKRKEVKRKVIHQNKIRKSKKIVNVNQNKRRKQMQDLKIFFHL